MRKSAESRGSILIWTMLLGISLATVFFFFSQRLNSNAIAQRETIEYQNARLFFESYIAYIESLNIPALESIRGDLSFQGISGTLTNETEQIAGVLDAGASVAYSAELPTPPADKIQIEWDICPKDDTEILELDPALPSSVAGGCPGLFYEKAAETTDASFSLSAPAGPAYYRLTAIGEGAVLYDNKWQLDLELPLGFRKKLTINTSFIPSS